MVDGDDVTGRKCQVGWRDCRRAGFSEEAEI